MKIDYIVKIKHRKYCLLYCHRTRTECQKFHQHLTYLINDSVDKLDKSREQLFHHLAAKLLYTIYRNRQDIQMGWTFL